jgi:benzoyl-CoA-dihydrodiol lyase
MTHVDFQTDPSRYKHWRIEIDGPLANLIMDVSETGGLFDGYELKLNSYDLGVDIELYDATQRLRFEHPQVKCVILRSGKERVFCAGANIRMLAASTHAHKVNFCKFTNETRNAMEDASAHSGQKYIAAITGACAGGGYELALACDEIILIDDSTSTVSLPEVALLAVLPGTGGLTRLIDKRKVRRDRADIFCLTEEGVKGTRALEWRLVDAIVPKSRIAQTVRERAQLLAQRSDRAHASEGIVLRPLTREFTDNEVHYSTLSVVIERARGVATINLRAPDAAAPRDIEALMQEGDRFWLLRIARELDDAVLHLRLNETRIGVLIFTCSGDSQSNSTQDILAFDEFCARHAQHWLVREVRLNWTRVLKRIDLTSRSLVALLEPGSCFTGTLAEVAFACDRTFMALDAFEDDNRAEARLTLSAANFGQHPMSNGLSRLHARFIGEPESLQRAMAKCGEQLLARDADQLGLVTSALDDIDWHDEVRIFIEERSSFSADALTAMEANLRFAGPETMETKIFGRLTAWQNWVFQRANAVGDEGALKRYGSGRKASFDNERI